MVKKIDKKLIEAKDDFTCFTQNHGKDGNVFVIYHKPSNTFCALKDESLSIDNLQRAMDYLSSCQSTEKVITTAANDERKRNPPKTKK